MPSKECQALANLYQSIAERIAANPNMDFASFRNLFEELQLPSAEPTDVTYEEIDAGGLPAMLIKPLNSIPDKMILYTHGGGFAAGSMNSHRKLVGHLAKATGCPALLLQYRLTPEHPFPAQIEDAVAAYRWLLDQGLEAGHIAIAGDSAGGGLATSATLKLKEDGLPQPVGTVAFSPWYDIENTGSTFQSNAATDKVVFKETVDRMTALYTAGDASKLQDPLANPMRADLTGLPPMYMTVGTYETLLENVNRFAEKARKAGVEVEVERAGDQQHVHVLMAGKAPEADATIRNAATWLKAKLGLATAES